MEIFKLFGSVLVDNKDADKSLSKTDSLAGKLAKGLGAGIKTAAKLAVGLGAMAVAGGAALLGVANKAAETADRVDKLSQKVGLSREGFQEWDHAMSQSGVNIESLQGGMKKLVNSLDDAMQGNALYVESFERIGLSMDDLAGKSPEQVFEMTVEALQKMPEGAEKAALANELLGRSGSELAPILNMTAEETAALKKEAHDLGLVMGDDAIDAGVKFGDTMANVKDSFGMLVTNIGISVMPVIQQFLDWIIANMPTIQGIFQTVFGVIQNVVKVAGDIFMNYILPAFQSIFAWVQANMPMIQQIIQTVWTAIQTAIGIAMNAIQNYIIPIFQLIWGKIQEVMPAIQELISTVWGKIQEIWNTHGERIMNIVKSVFGIIKTVISTAMDVIKGVIQFVTSVIKGDWSSAWNAIKSIASSVWEGIKNVIKGYIESAKNIISGVVDSIKSKMSGVWDSIKSKTSSVWEGIKSAISRPIEAARDKVKSVIDAVKGFFNFKISWPHIPTPRFGISPAGWRIGDLLKGSIPKLSINWNKEGGIFDKPTIFGTSMGLQGVGEAGPEAIMPISKLQQMVDFNSNREMIAETNDLLRAILEKDNNTYLDKELISKKLAPSLSREQYRLAKRGV